MSAFKALVIALILATVAGLTGVTAAKLLKPETPQAPAAPAPVKPQVQTHPALAVPDCTDCRSYYMPIVPGRPLAKNVPCACWNCYAADLQAAQVWGDRPVAFLFAAPTAIYVYWEDGQGWQQVYPTAEGN